MKLSMKMPQCKCRSTCGLVFDGEEWVCGECLVMRLCDIGKSHASVVTKIKSTRELIYKTQIAAEGGKSFGDCLAVVDGELAEIIERLEGR